MRRLSSSPSVGGEVQNVMQPRAGGDAPTVRQPQCGRHTVQGARRKTVYFTSEGLNTIVLQYVATVRVVWCLLSFQMLSCSCSECLIVLSLVGPLSCVSAVVFLRFLAISAVRAPIVSLVPCVFVGRLSGAMV